MYTVYSLHSWGVKHSPLSRRQTRASMACWWIHRNLIMKYKHWSFRCSSSMACGAANSLYVVYYWSGFLLRVDCRYAVFGIECLNIFSDERFCAIWLDAVGMFGTSNVSLTSDCMRSYFAVCGHYIEKPIAVRKAFFWGHTFTFTYYHEFGRFSRYDGTCCWMHFMFRPIALPGMPAQLSSYSWWGTWACHGTFLPCADILGDDWLSLWLRRGLTADGLYSGR